MSSTSYFKLDSEIVTLVGVGSSICGGSAIAATAPVIKAKRWSPLQAAISVIFFFNILAALLFPPLRLLVRASVIRALLYLLEQLLMIHPL